MEEIADQHTDRLRKMCDHRNRDRCPIIGNHRRVCHFEKLSVIIRHVIQRQLHLFRDIRIGRTHIHVSLLIRDLPHQNLIHIRIRCSHMGMFIRCHIRRKQDDIHTSHKDSQNQEIHLRSADPQNIDRSQTEYAQKEDHRKDHINRF